MWPFRCASDQEGPDRGLFGQEGLSHLYGLFGQEGLSHYLVYLTTCGLLGHLLIVPLNAAVRVDSAVAALVTAVAVSSACTNTAFCVAIQCTVA